MDITIYLYHNNRIFYDMDIPANSSICNECDNRTYIKFIDSNVDIKKRCFIRKEEDYGHSH